MSEQPFKALEQGSEAWKMARLGHVTASNVSDVMARGKDGEATTRYKYKVKLVAERLTTEQPESYTNTAMQWGIDQEQFAVIAYEMKADVMTDLTGFWLHPALKWVGASPDRLVGDDGLLEVKCPNTTTHLDYIFAGKVPAEYVKQVQAQLWITGRAWCDFVSFDPRLPPRNQLLVVRVFRDEKLIAEMETETVKFLGEVTSLINKLKE